VAKPDAAKHSPAPLHGQQARNHPVQGAGALLSTPSDIVRFGFAMLDESLLRPETLDMLRTPLELESGESTGYGLGWFIRSAPLAPETRATTIFGHSGTSVGGFTSFITLPEHDIVVAMTTNVSLAADRVPQRFLAEVLPSLSQRLAGIFAGSEAIAGL
jgi:CubicO group peptidase (beta-lactamase class C family)